MVPSEERFPYHCSVRYSTTEEGDGSLLLNIGLGSDDVLMGNESDRCRVITDHTVELLQCVSSSTTELLWIGSIESGAMLLDIAVVCERGDKNQTARREIEKMGNRDWSEMKVE